MTILDKVQIGNTVKVNLERSKDRLTKETIDAINISSECTIVDFKITDGKGIGVILNLSNGKEEWFFENEIQILDKDGNILENVENEKHVIRGDIRLKEIRIDPDNNNTQINENQYIQNLDVDFYYNLDFPITSKLNPEIIYCTIFDSAAGFIRGYVKIDTSDFKNSKPEMFLFENDMHGNSEPQVVVIDNIEYILTFNNNNENSYISLIDIDNKNINSVKIPTRIPPGFHSIYYDH